MTSKNCDTFIVGRRKTGNGLVAEAKEGNVKERKIFIFFILRAHYIKLKTVKASSRRVKFVM